MKRRVWRFVLFTVAILVGFAAGLGYGWAINPVRYTAASPDSLRMDYQTDFVLMTAELYQANGDLALALARLDFLGKKPLTILMDQTITYAEAHLYAVNDLQLMRDMAGDIREALDGTNK